MPPHGQPQNLWIVSCLMHHVQRLEFYVAILTFACYASQVILQKRLRYKSRFCSKCGHSSKWVAHYFTLPARFSKLKMSSKCSNFLLNMPMLVKSKSKRIGVLPKHMVDSYYRPALKVMD